MAALLALALLGMTGYAAFERGRDTVREQYASASTERDRLRAAKRDLESSNMALRERAALLEREAQVERQAYAEVDAHLERLQEEILELKEELAFYRSIAASEQAHALDIRSFDVRRDGGGEYLYRLVLTAAMKNDKVISGTVHLSVSGERGGRPVSLSLGELGEVQGIGFRLRHFQKIKGRLKLPRDFTPRRVLVQITASGGNQTKIEKSFDWPTQVG